MKNYKKLATIALFSLFAVNAEAVDMAAQPVVGDTLNGVAVAFESSPLPPNLQMLKTAKLASRSYLVADNNGEKQYFQIYYVDANNNGNLEYVITQTTLNGAGPSGIVDVFSMNNNKITFLGFNQFAAQSLGLSSSLVPCKNWYCNLAQPPFVYQGNAWFIRFKNSDNQICQYLWKGNTFINYPAVKGCIGATSTPTKVIPMPANVATKASVSN